MSAPGLPRPLSSLPAASGLPPVLELVPNLSEGRDPGFLREAQARVEATGAKVVDASADPDHHRSVLTILGAPAEAEASAMALAALALERIDLRRHRGVHPRVGALDVLPVIPLTGVAMEDAVALARRLALRLASELGIPTWRYGFASDPPGRGLAELRRGGFEGLVAGPLPPDRVPDHTAPGAGQGRLHPTAGGTCVGARPVLLAWNLDVEGLGADTLQEVARGLRAVHGGPPGLRVLALNLPEQGRSQLSMNLENALASDPWAVFEHIEARVREAGGTVTRTEVIGLAPDLLVTRAGAARLSMLDQTPPPLLSSEVDRFRAARAEALARRAVDAFEADPGGVSPPLRAALEALARHLSFPPQRNPQA